MQSTDLPEYHTDNRFEVIQKGGRVWINNATGLIDRFNPTTGIDVHSNGICDNCRSGAVKFDIFIASMMSQHQIDLTNLKNN